MDNLNICFDGRILSNGYTNNKGRTGIYFVVKNIVQYLSKRNINLYLFFEKERKINNKIVNDLKLNIDKTRILYPSSDFSNINSFLSPMFVIPDFLKQYPKVSCYTVLYDLIPLLFPAYYPNFIARWFYSLVENLSSDEYYYVISESTKQDYLKYFGDKLEKNNIDVIPLSTNLDYKPNKEQVKLNKVKAKYRIPADKKYLFSLCSLEPRKNLIRAVRTFIEFINKNKISDLVYVLGGDAWDGFIEKFRNEVPDYENYHDKIIRAGYVDDADLEILYSNAEWFVYTSQYEGFGMPPLEAMKCGCPVIASNNSSLPEVVGDCAITIDYDSDLQHIEAYEKYYSDKSLRREMVQKGLERASLFSWDRCIDVILKRMYEVEKKKANQPLVTIITDTFNLIQNNRKDYFLQNIESVQSQTYKNIEHVIIDGASTDGTIELLGEYQAKGLIKYYSESNEGLYFALNKGIFKANGKYVIYLSSDDFYCDRHAIEWLVSKIEEHDADVCYASVDELGNESFGEQLGKDAFMLLMNNNYNIKTCLIKTDAIKELGLYDIRYKFSAGMDFLSRLILNNKKIVCIGNHIVNTRFGDCSCLYKEQAEKELINSLVKNFGENYNLTKFDLESLKNFTFLSFPQNMKLELGAKLAYMQNKSLIKWYFNLLLNKQNNSFLINEKENYKLFNIIPLLKIKRKNNKTKVYLFSILPLLKIKRHDEKDCRVYLFSFIPFLRIKNKAKKSNFYLFSIIPILKIG